MSEPHVGVDAALAAPERHAARSAPAGLESGTRHLGRDPLRRRLLASADTLAVGATCSTIGSLQGAAAGVWALTSLPAWLLVAKLTGLYDRDHRSLRHLTVDEARSLGVWAAGGTAATLLLLYLLPPETPSYATGAAALATAAAAGFAFRVLARRIWRALTPPERALIVGTGSLAELTRRKLRLFADMHVEVVGEVAAAPVEGTGWLTGVDRVLLAEGAIDEHVVAGLVRACRERNAKLSMIPPTGAFGTAVTLTRIADLPVVEYNTWDISRSTLFLKGTIDVLAAAFSLVLLSPLLALVALAIVLDSRGSPIFVQRRAGRGGRPFSMLKFRTMVSDAEERLPEVVSLDDLEQPMFKLPRDPRVTRIGALLRRTSVDELPQLVNVLKGEMSLVGPRPEQVELVERYGPEHRFRLAVKPGMTGPMQVFGRGELTFEERLAVERDYLENLSLGRDIQILAMTVAAVAGGRGAY